MMADTTWESELETVAPLDKATLQGKGCLVRIRPMEISAGLIRVHDDGFLIGRDDRCDYTIHEDSVSRHHANIEQVGGAYIITDLNSTNGTFVNEQQVTSCALRAGDRVRLANHIFKFLSSDHIEAQYHETVYSMMTKDGLTGAYNKRYFLETLDREIERAKRFRRPLALALFDIDHFKRINDQHGHLAGDQVLQELSRRVSVVKRRDEIFARFGGEEFAMVMAETTLANAAMVAERIRKTIADEYFRAGEMSLAITLSVGVAVSSPECPADASELIAAADNKLYEAKNAGRNRVGA